MKYLLFSISCLILSFHISNAQVSDEFVLKYSTSPCYGKCMVFEMSITGHNVELKAKQHTPQAMGTHQKTLTQEQHQQLKAKIDAASFWELDDKYDGEITDLPAKWITLTDNGKSKKVMSRFGTPENLIALEKYLIDLMKDPSGWVETK